mgnify:CR=1 FL=1
MAMNLAIALNDPFAQQQFVKQQEHQLAGQLDLFFVYDVDGQPIWLGSASNDEFVQEPRREERSAVMPESSRTRNVVLESDNWRVQELMDNGSWFDAGKLQAAREELHQDILECTDYERGEARSALKAVVERIRELSH